MTELERARAHLRSCQKELARTRSMDSLVWWISSIVESRENNVLAALSWVWEEQEKERSAAGWDQVIYVSNQRIEMKPSKAATIKRKHKRRHRQFGMWRPLPKFKELADEYERITLSQFNARR